MEVVVYIIIMVFNYVLCNECLIRFVEIVEV